MNRRVSLFGSQSSLIQFAVTLYASEGIALNAQTITRARPEHNVNFNNVRQLLAPESKAQTVSGAHKH